MWKEEKKKKRQKTTLIYRPRKRKNYISYIGKEKKDVPRWSEKLSQRDVK